VITDVLTNFWFARSRENLNTFKRVILAVNEYAAIGELRSAIDHVKK
jgi:hypothetical protein